MNAYRNAPCTGARSGRLPVYSRLSSCKWLCRIIVALWAPPPPLLSYCAEIIIIFLMVYCVTGLLLSLITAQTCVARGNLFLACCSLLRAVITFVSDLSETQLWWRTMWVSQTFCLKRLINSAIFISLWIIVLLSVSASDQPAECILVCVLAPGWRVTDTRVNKVKDSITHRCKSTESVSRAGGELRSVM